MTVGVVLAVVASALALVRPGAGAGPVPDAPIAGNRTGFLSSCEPLPIRARTRCYVRGLLAAVERLGNPATALPVIDRRVHEVGGYLEAACHSLMHEVGRTWARRHRITIESLQYYVPRSNDPGCSAGFGMGLSMYLGPKLVTQPRSLLRVCLALPTRFREYTCVHGAGHAFMRGYHGHLPDAVRSCEALGRRYAPDCAQGAFHDYWISLGGSDGTTRPANADASPRSVCGQTPYKRPCWYRYFWERRPSLHVARPQDVLEPCDDLEGLQRAGCIGGVSLLASRVHEPAEHARLCAQLEGADAYDCLRGVNVPAVSGERFEQLRLIGACSAFSASTRAWCFAWFGRTLAVVTDGAFRTTGCARLRPLEARASCVAGARRAALPLRTFS